MVKWSKGCQYEGPDAGLLEGAALQHAARVVDDHPHFAQVLAGFDVAAQPGAVLAQAQGRALQAAA